MPCGTRRTNGNIPVAGQASPVGTSWILTSGLLPGAVFLAVLTRVADLIGKRPVIIVALVLVGCVINSVATTLPLIILGRVLIGAQLPMLALPEAIASDTMTPRRSHTAIFLIHVGTGSGVAGGLLVAALAGGRSPPSRSRSSCSGSSPTRSATGSSPCS